MLYLGHRPQVRSVETQKALNAAEGYTYFALGEEAIAELDRIHSAEQRDSAVLVARGRVLLQLRRWREAERVARKAGREYPDEGEFTVQRAFALHQLAKGEEAFETLLSAPLWLRRTGVLHYNLACYEARFGDLKIARQCIDAAIQINHAMRQSAKEDPDLAALYHN